MNQDNNYNEGAINRSTRVALTITVIERELITFTLQHLPLQHPPGRRRQLPRPPQQAALQAAAEVAAGGEQPRGGHRGRPQPLPRPQHQDRAARVRQAVPLPPAALRGGELRGGRGGRGGGRSRGRGDAVRQHDGLLQRPAPRQPGPAAGQPREDLQHDQLHLPASTLPRLPQSRYSVKLQTKVKRRFAKISQSRRRPLLGPSLLRPLRHYACS